MIVRGDADGCASLGAALQRASVGTRSTRASLADARATTKTWKGVGARSWEDLTQEQSGVADELADVLSAVGDALVAFAADLGEAQALATRARVLADGACLALSDDGQVPPVDVPAGPHSTPEAAAAAAEAARRAAVRDEVLRLCGSAREAQRDAHTRLLRVLRSADPPTDVPVPRGGLTLDGPVLTAPQWPDYVDLANGALGASAGIADRARKQMISHRNMVRALERGLDLLPVHARGAQLALLAEHRAALARSAGATLDWSVRAARLGPVVNGALELADVRFSAVPVLKKVPGLNIALMGVGWSEDVASGMDPRTAAVKQVAATGAGLIAGALVTGTAITAAPVLAGIAVGAVVGYGVGKVVEHWGDDIAEGVGGAAKSVWGALT